MQARLSVARIVCALVVGGFAMGGSVAAARDCAGLKNASQADLNECEGTNFAQADKALNDKYKRLSACLQGSQSSAPLLQSERAWVAFRDAECGLRASAVDGGSAQPMIRAGCLAELTAERGKQLDYYLSCQEGDLSCPASNCGQK